MAFWLYVFFASASLAVESAVVEGAKKEGALVFYTTMDIQNSKPLLDAFMKKYPFIKGDLVRLGGTAMVSRIVTEAQAGGKHGSTSPSAFLRLTRRCESAT